MTAFTNHFAFEFKTGLRNANLLLLNYLFPLGFYAMMGAVMTKINPTFIDVLIPAMVSFAIMVSSILGLPNPLVEARDSGVFRSFKINGVPALSILSIPMLTTILHSLITATIIALTAGPVFGGLQPQNWAPFVLLALLAAFTFGSLGALIGVISNNSRVTIFLSQAIFLPSMLLGGLMIPLDLLPKSAQPFAALLPTTYLMQAIKALAYGQTSLIDPTAAILVLAASSILAFGLAVYLFNWDSQNKTHRGHPLMALLVLVPYLAGMFLIK